MMFRRTVGNRSKTKKGDDNADTDVGIRVYVGAGVGVVCSAVLPRPKGFAESCKRVCHETFVRQNGVWKSNTYARIYCSQTNQRIYKRSVFMSNTYLSMRVLMKVLMSVDKRDK